MKSKHNARRARAAAQDRGETLPPIGKRARLAANPPAEPTTTYIIRPKLAVAPAIQAPVAELAEKPAAATDPRLTPLEEMGLSPVVYGILKALFLHTAGAVSDYTKRIIGMGPKRKDELRAVLDGLGLPFNLP